LSDGEPSRLGRAGAASFSLSVARLLSCWLTRSSDVLSARHRDPKAQFMRLVVLTNRCHYACAPFLSSSFALFFTVAARRLRNAQDR